MADAETSAAPRTYGRRIGSWVLRGALVGGVLTALLLLAVELGLRAWRPVEEFRPRSLEAANAFQLVHRASDVPGLAYELAPDARASAHGVEVRTNAHGMRDAEPLDATEAGGREPVRIAAIGDSFTFGQGVAGDATWSWVLEELLAEAPPAPGVRCDVLNFGVNGYCVREDLAVLRGKALEWDPALVIVGYALNDPDCEGSSGVRDFFREPAWWQHSHLLRLLRKIRLDQAVHRSGSFVAHVHAEPESWRAVQESFAAMRALTVDAGIPLLLVIFPVFYGGEWEAYEFRAVHEQVAREARANGFDVLDASAVYAERGVAPAELEVPGDGHPNPRGHRLAAEAIAAWVRAGWDRVEATRAR